MGCYVWLQIQTHMFADCIDMSMYYTNVAVAVFSVYFDAENEESDENLLEFVNQWKVNCHVISLTISHSFPPNINRSSKLGQYL